MKTMTCLSLSGMIVFVGLTAGCGDKEETIVIPPPPPVAPAAGADIGITSPTPPSGGTPATGQAETSPSLLDRPSPLTDEGLKAITKGMTQQQIDEFKETASFETHDTQIALIAEAANTYYNEFKRAPGSVEALVKAGHLPRMLQAPKGKKYVIDPTTLNVTSVSQ